MPGPLPKDPRIRQRTNKASTRTTLEATAPQRGRAPQLPRGRDWRTETRRWWRSVWHSPMAAEYLDADVHGLFRLAVLVDEFWTEPTPKLAGEIRLQQQAFGLTPLDRRRLEWSIEQVEGASSRRQQRRAQRVGEQAVDPRQVLDGEPVTKQSPAVAA